MIIYIDRTIGNLFEQRKPTNEEAALFCKVAQVQKDGKCIICGDIKSIDILIKILPPPYNQIYRIISGRHIESRALFDMVDTVIVLTGDIDAPAIPAYIEEKSIAITIDEAEDMDLSSGCHLVCENIDDCNFFEDLARCYMNRKSLHSINLYSSKENGGGNTTASVFEKCINQKAMTLCIADSDMKYGKSTDYPNDPARGDTLKKVQKVEKRLSDENCRIPFCVLPLCVHEVENLIPLTILEKMEEDLPCIRSGRILLEKLKEVDEGCPILYYDFKKGFSDFEEGPKLSYWREVFQKAKDTGIQLVDDVPKPWPAISSNNLLGRASKLIEKADFRDVLVDSHLSNHWDTIGKKVITWCCAYPKVRL